MRDLVAHVLDMVRVDAVVWWPGCWGRIEGWGHANGSRLDAAERAALDHAAGDELVSLGPVLTPYYRRRHVRLTAAGQQFLAAARDTATSSAS